MRHSRAARVLSVGQTPLEMPEANRGRVFINLHGGGFVNETWEKWFKGSMTVKIVANPYF